MWPLTRHNDAAEILASLLILSAIRGGRKIFFPAYQTEVKNKPHQIEKKPDYHTAACGKSTTYTLDNMTRSSAIILLILCTQCTATSAGGAKLTRFDRSLKQGNSFHDMPPLPRIIQQCGQRYTF